MAKFQYLSYFLDDKTPIYGGDSGIDIMLDWVKAK